MCFNLSKVVIITACISIIMKVLAFFHPKLSKCKMSKNRGGGGLDNLQIRSWR